MKILRPLRWVRRGGDLISACTRLMVVMTVGVVAITVVVGLARHIGHVVAGAFSHGRQPAHPFPGWHLDDLLLALCLASLVMLTTVAILLAVVRRERERRAEDPERRVRHHRALAGALLAAGAILGAIPSGLSGPWWLRATATAVVMGVAWGWAWRAGGAQPGDEPPWRAGLRLGVRRMLRLEAGQRYLAAPCLWLLLGATAVSGLLACCLAGVYGGDGGLLVAAGGATAWTWRIGTRGSKAARDWWRRARSAAGAADVARVWVRPDYEDPGAPWGADIVLTRGHEAPAVERAANTLQSLLGRDWAVTPRALSRRLVCRHVGLLPALAPMPTEVTTGAHELPLGVARGGRPVSWDVDVDPHALVAGKTGSGKTVAITVLAAGALLRGWELVVVETVKGGLDYRPLQSWCSMFATDLEGAAWAVEGVYREVERRRALLLEHGAVKVGDLPARVHCAPMLVVADEFFSMVVPNKLKTEDAKEVNALKARIAGTVGKLMREARFADVHLVLGMQRPDATVFEGEVKANTGMRLLAGTADRIARSMVLRDAEGAPNVSKDTKGRAVLEAESQDAEEIQLYLAAVVPGRRDPPGTPIIPDVLRRNCVEPPTSRPSPPPKGASPTPAAQSAGPKRPKRRRVVIPEPPRDAEPPPLPE